MKDTVMFQFLEVVHLLMTAEHSEMFGRLSAMQLIACQSIGCTTTVKNMKFKFCVM